MKSGDTRRVIYHHQKGSVLCLQHCFPIRKINACNSSHAQEKVTQPGAGGMGGSGVRQHMEEQLAWEGAVRVQQAGRA